ncbi:hypothetical protein Q5P01_020705 [Channa striata]|uniref:Uncharacterized protein n=1 Tax=Channa striata TaxID=64152 RepID=A0AA88LY48_CHASR|nr:hypothetical protein Q5P01_020705 [Channa striata]
MESLGCVRRREKIPEGRRSELVLSIKVVFHCGLVARLFCPSACLGLNGTGRPKARGTCTERLTIKDRTQWTHTGSYEGA